MNILQLRYFHKLAENEHYGKTAKELGITQSALSNSITRLEKELNISLFERNGRNVRLTSCGLEFDQYILNALEDLDKAVEITKKYQKKDIHKIIKIAAVNSVERSYIPSLISAFKSNVQLEVTFDVYQKSTYEALLGLKKGFYDIAFCSRSTYADELEYIPIKLFKLIAVANESNPLANKESISLRELANYPLASYRNSCILHEFMKGLFEQYNLDANQSFDDEIGGASLASCNKNAVSIMLDTVRDIPFKKCKALPIKELNNYFHLVCCVNDPNRINNDLVNKFLDFIRSNAKLKDFKEPLEDNYWIQA